MRVLIWAGVAVFGLTALAWSQAGNGDFIVGPGTQGATIGGVPLLPGTVVLPGETITTAAGGVVVMAEVGTQGGIVEIGPNSSASASETNGVTELHMTSGTAEVTGLSVVTPQGAVIQPNSPHSEYIVDASGADSSVGVIKGSVDVNDTANHTPPIGAGRAVEVYYASNGQVDTERTNFNTVNRLSTNFAVTNRSAGSASH